MRINSKNIQTNSLKCCNVLMLCTVLYDLTEGVKIPRMFFKLYFVIATAT